MLEKKFSNFERNLIAENPTQKEICQTFNKI